MTHVDKARAWNAIAEKNAEIGRLKNENEKLRKALGPFACLGMNELTPGDRNRARRALGLNGVAAGDGEPSRELFGRGFEELLPPVGDATERGG